MPWSAPVSPVTGTVITVSWATTNVVNLLNWLRTMTGNADPPAGGYVVGSVSPTSTQWQKVNNTLLADDAVDSRVLADQAVLDANIAFNTINGDARIIDSSITGNASTSAIGTNCIHANRMQYAGNGVLPISLGADVNWRKLDPSCLSLDATLPTAGLMLGFNNSNGLFTWKKIDQSNLSTPNTPSVGTFLGWNNTTGTLEWQTPAAASGAFVPSGMIAAFATASMPTGWVRFSQLNGRLPVGDGTAGGSSFAVTSTYGNTWDHQHGLGGHVHTGPSHAHSEGAHAHGAAGLTVSGGASGSSAQSPQFNAITPGSVAAADGHTHGWSGSVGGATAAATPPGTGAAGTGNTSAPTSPGNVSDATTWLPLMYSVVWGQKS
jgi:hypothetical protein